VKLPKPVCLLQQMMDQRLNSELLLFFFVSDYKKHGKNVNGKKSVSFDLQNIGLDGNVD